ncbi:hypothetical protein [Rhodococcus sp. (in: high G+C Gram-positive bacteria)]|uniref:hypothetical protein n=1 Tax=Rhodococcus sp. TaxID=1831 RepID=UPI003B8A76E5
MKFTVQPIFSGRRRNSPRAETLCSDLTTATLPLALFVADEAEVTVTAEDGDGLHGGRCLVRALVGVGVDDDFTEEVRLLGDVPSLGLVDAAYRMNLAGTVGAAVDACAIQFAVGLAERLAAVGQAAHLQVRDHRDEILVDTAV